MIINKLTRNYTREKANSLKGKGTYQNQKKSWKLKYKIENFKIMTRIPRAQTNKVIKRIMTLTGLPRDLKPRKELQRLRKNYLKPLRLNSKENKDQLKTK